MDYSRLYSTLLTHPKWMVLSKDGKVLLVQAWMYAAGQETDGYVHEAASKLIGVTQKVAQELEEGGWWKRNGAGWDLNDWLEHQESAAQIKRRRKQTRERTAEWRRRMREEAS